MTILERYMDTPPYQIDQVSNFDEEKIIAILKSDLPNFKTRLIQLNGITVYTNRSIRSLIREIRAEQCAVSTRTIDAALALLYGKSPRTTYQRPLVGKECLYMPLNSCSSNGGEWLALHHVTDVWNNGDQFNIRATSGIHISLTTNPRLFKTNYRIAWEVFALYKRLLFHDSPIEVPKPFRNNLQLNEHSLIDFIELIGLTFLRNHYFFDLGCTKSEAFRTSCRIIDRFKKNAWR